MGEIGVMNKGELLTGLRRCEKLMNEMDSLQDEQAAVQSKYKEHAGYTPFGKEWKGKTAILRCVGIFMLLFIIAMPSIVRLKSSDLIFLKSAETPEAIDAYLSRQGKRAIDALVREAQNAFAKEYHIGDEALKEEFSEIGLSDDKQTWLANWITKRLKNELEQLHNKTIRTFAWLTVFAAFLSTLAAWCSLLLINKCIRRRNASIAGRNEKIEKENESIDAQNLENYQREMAVVQDMDEVSKAFQREVSPWFPPDYLFPDALGFFIHAVENSRANNVTEAVNLYEDMLHKLRMEKGQQEMLQKQCDIEKQQKLGNLLAAGSLVAQFVNGRAIERNTNAVNEHKASVNYQADAINSHKAALNDVGNAIRKLKE